MNPSMVVFKFFKEQLGDICHHCLNEHRKLAKFEDYASNVSEDFVTQSRNILRCLYSWRRKLAPPPPHHTNVRNFAELYLH